MTKPMPGFKGMDHVGITVPDIESATRFFVDVIGCKKLFDVGPFESPDNWMADHLDVNPRSKITKLRMLQCADNGLLELFEYVVPGQKKEGPRNSDVGGMHVAFYVDDMGKALDQLRKHGAKLLAGPTTMTEGPSAGLTWIYFNAPWGLQLELVSYPNGMAFQKKG